MRRRIHGYYAAPLIAPAVQRCNGGIPFVCRHDATRMDTVSRILAGQMAIGIENANLFDELQRSNVELSLAYDATIEGWPQPRSSRHETEGHTQRVTEMTLQLARKSGLRTRRWSMSGGERSSTTSVRWSSRPDFALSGHTHAGRSVASWRGTPPNAYHLLSPIGLAVSLDIPYCHQNGGR